jgi:methyl-accepting chemotaxis protein-2 (aspartate sensor receptor)
MISFLIPLKKRIHSLARTFSEHLPGEFSLDESTSIMVAGQSTPVLRLDGKSMNLNFAVPDRFTEATGGTATLFVRRGDDFVRVTTSVKKQDGERAIGTILDRSHPAYRLLLAGQFYLGYATIFGKQFMTQYDPIIGPNERVIGVRYVGLDVSRMRTVGVPVRAAAITAGLYGLAFLAFCWLTRPIMPAVAEYWLVRFGLLSCLGMAFAVYVLMVRNVSRPMEDCRTAAGKIAAGDLSAQVHVSRRDDVGQLLQAINGISVGLANVVGEVRRASDGVHTGSHQIAAGTSDLSTRTQTQAAALEETASAMEELASTVMQNAMHAGEASALVASAATLAQNGGEMVGQVIASMAEIKSKSRSIENIIGLIDGIAFQSNILALNAAVEAARAGEHGRGFSVVATEVRTLAQRSATAAREIKALIAASMETVDAGCELADRTGVTTNEISGSIRQASVLMMHISTASNEQSKGLAEIKNAIELMDQATQQNAALVEQSAAAAMSMEEQAAHLSKAVAVFKTAQ